MGPQELEASCALGLLYESQGQPGLAMSCHERCLQLSNELQRPDDAATAYAQLVQVGNRAAPGRKHPSAQADRVHARAHTLGLAVIGHRRSLGMPCRCMHSKQSS